MYPGIMCTPATTPGMWSTSKPMPMIRICPPRCRPIQNSQGRSPKAEKRVSNAKLLVRTAWCQYTWGWIDIKSNWKLTFTTAEKKALEACTDTTVAVPALLLHRQPCRRTQISFVRRTTSSVCVQEPIRTMPNRDGASQGQLLEPAGHNSAAYLVAGQGGNSQLSTRWI